MSKKTWVTDVYFKGDDDIGIDGILWGNWDNACLKINGKFESKQTACEYIIKEIEFILPRLHGQCGTYKEKGCGMQKGTGCTGRVFIDGVQQESVDVGCHHYTNGKDVLEKILKTIKAFANHKNGDVFDDECGIVEYDSETYNYYTSGNWTFSVTIEQKIKCIHCYNELADVIYVFGKIQSKSECIRCGEIKYEIICDPALCSEIERLGAAIAVENLNLREERDRLQTEKDALKKAIECFKDETE